jgi:hypothetical protein
MKTANSLEKMIERIEGINHKFVNRHAQHEFDGAKDDAIALLEEMVQLLHDDEEAEEEGNSEEE